MSKCNFVELGRTSECGEKKNLTKITINIPNQTLPIVKWACRRHGDQRFIILSQLEILLTKQEHTGKIDHTKFSDEMKLERWKKCRKCHQVFLQTDTVCELDYHWVKDTRVSLRRSFLLHLTCTNQELDFYKVPKMKTNQTLEEAGMIFKNE